MVGLWNHSEFDWENYGAAWEINHVISFELMDKKLVSDRFRLNNWSNLAPRTSEANKKERSMKLAAAAARSTQTKAAGPAETEAAGPAETEAARPTEPESIGY